VVAGDVVLEEDHVAAEDVAGVGDDRARLGRVVHLRQRRHAGGQALVVRQLAQAQAQQLHGGDLAARSRSRIARSSSVRRSSSR
jgi:hypothetical protein